MAKKDLPQTTSSKKNNEASNAFSPESNSKMASVLNLTKNVGVRGKRVAPDSTLVILNRGYKRIQKSGTTGKLSNALSQDNFAKAILQSIGCSICDEAKDFSLLQTQTDSEAIDNENIIDTEDYKNIKNESLQTDFAFSNAADPFYTTDDAPARTTRRQFQQAKDSEMISVENLVKDLINLNFSKGASTSKYFM